jgi:amino-acid N-acetyltransferase
MEYGRVYPEDLDQVRRLLSECGLPVQDVDLSLMHYFIGARRAGRLVGVVGVQPLGEIGLLRSLAVDPALRGQGIGSRLVDEAESLGRAGNLRELCLLTSSGADYFAERMYQRCDRAQLPASVQATAQFRQLCPASAVAMRKPLLPS